MPRSQHQLLVRDVRGDFIAELIEFAPQVVAAVQADVAEQPGASVERARLRGTLGRRSRSQKCEAKSRARLRCDVSAVGSAKRQRLSHPLEQTRIRRRTIQ